MLEVSFADIYTLGSIIFENENYRHFYYPRMLSRYDSNLIEFKQEPTLMEFKKVEGSLRDFQIKRGLDYMKFRFPPNVQFSDKLISYLKDSAYGRSFIELYAIDPSNFPSVESNTAIDIQRVTEDNLEKLINFKYRNDLEFGKEFAREKRSLTRRQFEDPSILQVAAFYQGNLAGYVDLIVAPKTVEIDDLTVEPVFQRKGIGSRLQNFAMVTFPDKTVILLADGEDTPREMYQKQNYQYLGFQYETLKLF